MTYPILALDIAKRCGWASMASAGEPVQSGVRTITGTNAGTQFASAEFLFAKTLFAERLRAGLREVVVEAPIARTHMAAARMLFGYHAVLRLIAHRYSVRVVEYSPQAIKKAWTGNGRATKQMMVDEARFRGYDPEDDNEADALALLHLALESRDPETWARLHMRRMQGTGDTNAARESVDGRGN